MRTTIRTEVIGKSRIYLVENKLADWLAPRYYVERSTIQDDGSTGSRVAYGGPGFRSVDEALEFGREWCQVAIESAEPGR